MLGRITSLITSVAALAATILVAGPVAASSRQAATAAPGPARPGTVVSAQQLPTALWLPGTRHAHRLRYLSTSWDGSRTVVSGAVFLPEGRRPTGGWPIISWAHGTVGVADVCAPSTAGRSPRDIEYLSAWLAAGYAVVATDYEGLGTPGPHPYINGPSAAHATIDMVRAARQVDRSLSRSWAVVGQSQGGHAALWTAAVHARYAPELNFRGAISTAPPTQFQATVAALPPLQPAAAATSVLFIIASGIRATNSDVDLRNYFTETGLSLLHMAETSHCLDTLGTVIAARGLTNNDVLTDMTALARMIALQASQEIPIQRYTAPVYIAQGAADTTVIPAMTQRTAQELAAARTDVTFTLYPGADHDGVLRAALPDLLTWTADRFDRAPAPH
ncbi:lipase family protein [Micromonospora sp. NPDC085948]|uniref:alpha/beta hydrolase family protein n=1 Tax=Micromonospora sp. NPDC085948 TaxID=3155293 RepID=UPI00343B50B8